ncbi:MAG: thioredoxin domain-containing protein [Planctomycetota bacterium]
MSKSENQLGAETSPYLLQHARNPVDWYPWGPAALARSKAEGRPIFLSIGYSACHWCHVMERESFENEAIARLMNEHFVNVKVDREERPDLDEIYMKAVQAMTGSGGWPMSVFLTPDLEPFYGGTYFPPRSAHGRPGFPEVLTAIARAWREDRENVASQGRRMAKRIADEGTWSTIADLDPHILDRSFAMLQQSHDPDWGGFGAAPKFPHALDIRILLRHSLRTKNPVALKIATTTLDRMAEGGIRDHLGGGFHRYSTDEKWLIPHFEKMLYDTALLLPAYLDAHLLTGAENYARVARECVDWVLREMVTPEGGFASSQDADSEGEEGRFFVWTPEELAAVLGPRRGSWAAAWFGVTDEGNFEHGKSALWRHETPEDVARELRCDAGELAATLQAARSELWKAREARVHPATDDKVLVSWNGLMISALAQCHQVLGETRALDAARNAARFILGSMRRGDGRLFATSRGGRAHLDAYLDDYAFLIQALIDLYESDFDESWIREAIALEAIVTDRFADAEKGGWFTTARDHEALIARLKNPHDGALPSGNGVQALNLLRLAELTGRGELALRAESAIRSLGAMVNQYPAAFSQLLMAVDFLAAGPREIVIAGELSEEPVREMVETVRRTFLPQRVVASARSGADVTLLPLLEDKQPGPGGARAYVCRNYACREPVESAEALGSTLRAG